MAADISLSAGKAIEVFKVICDLGDRATLAEIVRSVGYPRTVVARMVAALEHHDFVERNPKTGICSVSLTALHLVQKSTKTDPILANAESIMRQVVDQTSDIALFMVKRGHKASVLLRIDGTAPLSIGGSRVGMELPLHCGGAPFALLAFSGDDEIESYLSNPLEARTPKTSLEPDAIWKRIHETRARGYAIGDEDMFEYVVALGVPIFGPNRRLIGAVSVGNIVQKYPENRIREVGEKLLALTQ